MVQYYRYVDSVWSLHPEDGDCLFVWYIGKPTCHNMKSLFCRQQKSNDYCLCVAVIVIC
jgi:hypothetical protein